MPVSPEIKELDKILQIIMPDSYYKDMRKKLIPHLLRWKKQKPKRVVKPKVNPDTCNCHFKDNGKVLKCVKCGQTMGQWLAKEAKKEINK